MRSIGVFGYVAVIMSIAACAPSPLAERWPGTGPGARPLGRDLATYRPPPKPLDKTVSKEAQTIREPTDTLTLRQALALSLVRNAELRSFAWEVRAAEARMLQASLLPNPELGAEVENVGGSGRFKGADLAETTITLSQLIELGGKRSKRTRVASLERDLAGWDYEARRIEVLTEVAQRFVDVLSAQRRVGLAQEAAQLAQQFYDAVTKRVEAGATSPLEKVRASVVVSTSRITLQRALRQLQASRYQLAATWSNTNPQFKTVAGELETVAAIPSAQSLSRLISQNPDIARWAVEITQRRAAMELAKAQGVPDLTVGAGVRRLSETDDTAGVFVVSLPLPIFNRNQGGILEARFNIVKAQQERRAAEVRIGAALGTIYQELFAAHHEAVALKQDVLPAARQSFQGISEAFRQGKIGYLDVLDAQRTLINVQGQYLDALGAYHNAVAAVEGLIGQSLSTVEDSMHNDRKTQPEPLEPGDDKP